MVSRPVIDSRLKGSYHAAMKRKMKYKWSGKAFKETCRLRSTTPTVAARKAGISERATRYYANGRQPPVEAVYALAKALQVHPDIWMVLDV